MSQFHYPLKDDVGHPGPILFTLRGSYRTHTFCEGTNGENVNFSASDRLLVSFLVSLYDSGGC